MEDKTKKSIRCLGCGLFFAVSAGLILPHFTHCDDHFYCEPQEHIEVQKYQPNVSSSPTYNIRGSSSSIFTGGSTDWVINR